MLLGYRRCFFLALDLFWATCTTQCHVVAWSLLCFSSTLKLQWSTEAPLTCHPRVRDIPLWSTSLIYFGGLIQRSTSVIYSHDLFWWSILAVYFSDLLWWSTSVIYSSDLLQRCTEAKLTCHLAFQILISTFLCLALSCFSHDCVMLID